MNPTVFLATLAAACFGAAQAGYIYIWNPYAATQCQAGQACPISWHVSNDGPQFSRVDIELLSGDANQAQVVAPIVLGYDLSQGNSFIWTVPDNFASYPDAFIRIKGVGTDYQSYSHRFPISGNTTATVTPATSTATTATASTATRSGSVTSSATRTSIKTVSATSSSSAMSIQGSVSAVAAVVAAAFAVLLF